MTKTNIAPAIGAAQVPLKVLRGGLANYVWYEVTGPREAIISTGIAAADWFPEGRKRHRYSDGPYTGFGWRTKKLTGDLVSVRLDRPSGALAEALERMVTEESPHSFAERQRREGELRAAFAEASGVALANMPTTHAAYRADRVQLVGAFLKTVVEIPDPCRNHGFSYDDEARAEMADLAERMIDLMKTGTTVFDAKRHASIVQSHNAGIARGDAKFVGMLAALAVAREAGEEVDHG